MYVIFNIHIYIYIYNYVYIYIHILLLLRPFILRNKHHVQCQRQAESEAQ